jgi:Skp family chaperone for outer membrane proteins
MNWLLEKWAERGTKSKVLWSVGAVFVLLIIIGAASSGSKKKATASRLAIPVQTTATVQAESPVEMAHRAEEEKNAKAQDAKATRERVARERHEAHVRAARERAKKAREGREHAAALAKLQQESNAEEAEESKKTTEWHSEEGAEARKALIASIKAQGGGAGLASCVADKFEQRFSLEEAVAVAQEVNATGKPSAEVVSFREACEGEGKF